MAGYAEAVRLDLRRNAVWMALAALAAFCLGPLLFSVTALPAREAARLMETVSALAGTAALCALFFPEREAGVRETLAARALPLAALWSARALWLLAWLWVLSGGGALCLRAAGCDAHVRLALAGFANAVFLGGMAALCAALSGSLAFALALPLVYFAMDLCAALPPPLTLFCDARGLDGNKLALCLCGLAMLTGAIFERSGKK